MLDAANRTLQSVTGWRHVFSARARMAVLSCPRAGGELKSAPTMENRKRAQSPLVGFLGVSVITSPHEIGEGSAITSIGQPAEQLGEHPLRVGCDRQES